MRNELAVRRQAALQAAFPMLRVCFWPLELRPGQELAHCPNARPKPFESDGQLVAHRVGSTSRLCH